MVGIESSDPRSKRPFFLFYHKDAARSRKIWGKMRFERRNDRKNRYFSGAARKKNARLPTLFFNQLFNIVPIIGSVGLVQVFGGSGRSGKSTAWNACSARRGWRGISPAWGVYKGYAFESRAILKRVFVDPFNAVANSNAFEAWAVVECPFANDLDTVRYYHTRDSRAWKCTVSDARELWRLG